MIEHLLNRLFKQKVIVNCDHDPYLYRWYVFQTKYVSLFVHKFVRSDEDRALHDHPWAFLVIPIWRGYYEFREEIVDMETASHLENLGLLKTRYVREDGCGFTCVGYIRRRVLPIIGTRFRPATYRHRVQLLQKWQSKFSSYDPQYGVNWYENRLVDQPAWSLFFHFHRMREWGFWPKEGFIQWNKWWQDKCE